MWMVCEDDLGRLFGAKTLTSIWALLFCSVLEELMPDCVRAFWDRRN